MLNPRTYGFTVVEMLIVIVVIAILATLGTVGYRGIQARAQDTELKSDIQNVSEQIELAYLKDNTYPTALSALGTISKDANTTFAYLTTGQTFCLTATSTISGSKTYSVVNDGKVTEGNCTTAGYAGPPSQPAATIASVTTNSFVVNWTAASGATSYTVRYGTTASPPPATQATSCSAFSCNITGLANNTTYYVTVTANNSAGSTVSAQRSARTGGTYIGSAPGPIMICAIPSGGINAGWTKTSAAARLHVLIETGYETIDEELDPHPSYPNLFVYDFGQSGGGGTITATVSFIDASGNESAATTSSGNVGATDCYD
jgi:prepilin-type N-terminal cleavage/methylation domain-containing protein